MVERLTESGDAAAVLSSSPKTFPSGTIVVTGMIDNLDEGSEVLRFLIGFGIGGATAHGRFAIADANGRTLAVFERTKTASGGSGLGAHWNPLHMEDVVEALGRDVAEAVLRWSQGESLDP